MKKSKIKKEFEKLGFKVESVDYWWGSKLHVGAKEIYGCIVFLEDSNGLPTKRIEAEGESKKQAGENIITKIKMMCGIEPILTPTGFGYIDFRKEVKVNLKNPFGDEEAKH